MKTKFTIGLKMAEWRNPSHVSPSTNGCVIGQEKEEEEEEEEE